MRVNSLALKEFKGLDVDLSWASAIVLFGPNDSGKTNILEAIEFLFTGTPSGRVDRFRQFEEPYPPETEMLFELDALGIAGSGDQELLVRWLTELLPNWSAGDVLDELRHLAAAVPEAEDRAGALDAVVRCYRDLGRQVIGSLALPAGAEVDHDDAATLAAAVAGSNRFFMSFDETVWLAPTREELSREARVALAQVEAAAGGDFDYPEQLLPLANEGKFSEGLVRILRFNFEQSGVEDLYRELERFVDREMARRESVNFNFTGGRIPIELFVERFRWDPRGRRDTWLEGDGESFSLHPLVLEVCEDISERSNNIAPRFITREYEIRIHRTLRTTGASSATARASSSGPTVVSTASSISRSRRPGLPLGSATPSLRRSASSKRKARASRTLRISRRSSCWMNRSAICTRWRSARSLIGSPSVR